MPRQYKNKYFNQDFVSYKNNHLYLEGRHYTRFLAEGTPLACTFLNRIITNTNIIRTLLNKYYPDYLLCYALKASYLKNVLMLIKNLDLGVSATSSFEIRIAESANINNKRIVFNGVGRTAQEIYSAIKKGNIVNLDSDTELKRLISCKRPNEKLFVGLRIRPSLHYLQGPEKYSILGMDYKTAKVCIDLASKNNIVINGISFHLFSNMLDGAGYVAVINEILKFIKYIAKERNVKITYLDIGGGFAPRMYFKSDADIKRMLLHIACLLKSRLSHVKLILELGRFIVSDATGVLSKIVSIKKTKSGVWAILDASTNFLIPAPGNKWDVSPCHLKKGRGPITFVDRMGTIIAKTSNIRVNEEDLVFIFNAGAYTAVMKELFAFPLPKQILVRNGTIMKVLKEPRLYDVIKYHG